LNNLYPQTYDQNTLVISLNNGDREALQHLYDCYAGPLYGLIRKKISEDGIAEEMLQNVFAKIWQHRSTFKKEYDSLFTFLSTITRNEILDHLEKSADDNSETLKANQTNSKTNTVDMVECTDINYLKQFLVQLQPKYRAILELHFVRGYSYFEIGNLFQMEASDIQKKLVEGCEQLRSLGNTINNVA
jgi:RNA polymerase sigma-70 factor (ECF subfamily)